MKNTKLKNLLLLILALFTSIFLWIVINIKSQTKIIKVFTKNVKIKEKPGFKINFFPSKVKIKLSGPRFALLKWNKNNNYIIYDPNSLKFKLNLPKNIKLLYISPNKLNLKFIKLHKKIFKISIINLLNNKNINIDISPSYVEVIGSKNDIDKIIAAAVKVQSTDQKIAKIFILPSDSKVTLKPQYVTVHIIPKKFKSREILLIPPKNLKKKVKIIPSSIKVYGNNLPNQITLPENIFNATNNIILLNIHDLLKKYPNIKYSFTKNVKIIIGNESNN